MRLVAYCVCCLQGLQDSSMPCHLTISETSSFLSFKKRTKSHLVFESMGRGLLQDLEIGKVMQEAPFHGHKYQCVLPFWMFRNIFSGGGGGGLLSMNYS